jgi:pimeloyl-ACP methyl ester carboxylesterase
VTSGTAAEAGLRPGGDERIGATGTFAVRRASRRTSERRGSSRGRRIRRARRCEPTHLRDRTAIYPPGAEPGDRLPVCLFLHGRNRHHTDAAGPRHFDRFLAGAVDEGAVAPFVIVAVDGGDAVNWHRRANGDDPPAMIRSELLPLLADRGLDVERPALWGVSLGGYGALYCATLPDTEVSAVAALSPALWKHPGEWREGTFDDDADFAATNVWDRRDRLRGIPLRIDCGASDVFVDRVREFRGSLDPTPAGGIEEGGHDGRYWSRQTPAELAFIGQALRR